MTSPLRGLLSAPGARILPFRSIISRVPSKNYAGLIGKKGLVINDMQDHSGARIKLSQAHDFFPGTQGPHLYYRACALVF